MCFNKKITVMESAASSYIAVKNKLPILKERSRDCIHSLIEKVTSDGVISSKYRISLSNYPKDEMITNFWLAMCGILKKDRDNTSFKSLLEVMDSHSTLLTLSVQLREEVIGGHSQEDEGGLNWPMPSRALSGKNPSIQTECDSPQARVGEAKKLSKSVLIHSASSLTYLPTSKDSSHQVGLSTTTSTHSVSDIEDGSDGAIPLSTGQVASQHQSPSALVLPKHVKDDAALFVFPQPSAKADDTHSEVEEFQDLSTEKPKKSQKPIQELSSNPNKSLSSVEASNTNVWTKIELKETIEKQKLLLSEVKTKLEQKTISEQLLKDEIKVLKEEVKELKIQLDECNQRNSAEVRSLEERLEQKNRELKSIKLELSSAQSKLADQEKELSKGRNEVEQIEKEHMVAIEEQEKAHKVEKAELHEKYSASLAKITAGKTGSESDRYKAVKKERDALKEEKRQLEQRSEFEVTKVLLELQKKKTKIAEKEKIIAEQAAEIATLKAEIKVRDKDEEVQFQIDKMSEETQKLENENQILRRDSLSYQRQLSEYKEEEAKRQNSLTHVIEEGAKTN